MKLTDLSEVFAENACRDVYLMAKQKKEKSPQATVLEILNAHKFWAQKEILDVLSLEKVTLITIMKADDRKIAQLAWTTDLDWAYRPSQTIPKTWLLECMNKKDLKPIYSYANLDLVYTIFFFLSFLFQVL